MKTTNFTRRDFLHLGAATGLTAVGHALIEPIFGSSGSNDKSKPNVLILVFDAFSAADMSLYGYPRATTPNFDQFAHRAAVFHRHYASGSFTTPGTASLLTGVLPWTHRAINLQGITAAHFVKRNIFSLFPASYHRFSYTHNSLVQVLLDQYRASIDDLREISDLGLYSDIWSEGLPLGEFRLPIEAELLSVKNSFSQNSSLFLSLIDEARRTAASRELLQAYRKEFPRGLPNCRPADRYNSLCFTLETAIDWIADQFTKASQPFLGYVHLFPPHAPYNPRREFINLFKDQPDPEAKPEHFFSQGSNPRELGRQRRRYNEAIAYVDAEFGRLINLLDSRKALDSTLLVVTSDHGEMFERGISGHNTEVLYEPLIRIPLLISLPGQKTRVDVHTRTSAIDVLPTILDQLHKSPGTPFEGQPLPIGQDQQIPEREIYVVEAKSSPQYGRLNKATFALLRENYKLIYYLGYDGLDDVYELYDLDADPDEREDLYPSRTEIARELAQSLRSKLEKDADNR